MSKRLLLLLGSLALLAAAGIAFLFMGGDIAETVYGPDDYKHFSDFFTMNESAEYEMNLDGGTVNMAPGDAEAEMLVGNAADAENSPAVSIES